MKSDKPKISVLMPVYNGEQFLDKSIKSVLNQTFNNFEYIIINDGSTDDSLKIIESYKDSRIKNNKFFKKYGYHCCFKRWIKHSKRRLYSQARSR